MNLFRLDTSIRAEGSFSRQLADVVEKAWTDQGPDRTVTRRDLGSDPLPADAWQTVIAAAYLPEGQRTDRQRAILALATAVADELLEADAYVFGFPLYNYGVSQHVKVWIDLLLTDPRLGPGVERPLDGRPASLIVARGGGYGEGTPKHGWDHATAYYQRILGDQLGLDLHLTELELTLADVTPAMESLRDTARELLTASTAQAADHGRILVERVGASA